MAERDKYYQVRLEIEGDNAGRFESLVNKFNLDEAELMCLIFERGMDALEAETLEDSHRGVGVGGTEIGQSLYDRLLSLHDQVGGNFDQFIADMLNAGASAVEASLLMPTPPFSSEPHVIGDTKWSPNRLVVDPQAMDFKNN